jgi:hypothetical protein
MRYMNVELCPYTSPLGGGVGVPPSEPNPRPPSVFGRVDVSPSPSDFAHAKANRAIDAIAAINAARRTKAHLPHGVAGIRPRVQ